MIGRGWGTYENPTLSMVASDLSDKYGFGTLRVEEVAYAARLREVEPLDGRVPHSALADIYFELRRLKGLEKVR